MAIVAEIKRASPSAGAIRLDLDPAEVADNYEKNGAHALSVLTCPPFFHGKTKDLTKARKKVKLPVLCKDFILTGFQVIEAAAAGADAILLIAAALDDEALRELTEFAREWNLEVLHEVHDERELERVLPLEPTLVGVNSRNLNTMEVEPATALRMARHVPDSALPIYESGIRSTADLQPVVEAGYRAVLIGESLLTSPDPGFALYDLLEELEEL